MVYSNLIFHWPSNYSTKLRRMIHLGYRLFGGATYPYTAYFYWNLRFTKHLSPAARARIKTLFRAMLRKEPDTFRTQLAALHPGETGRMVAVVCWPGWRSASTHSRSLV